MHAASAEGLVGALPQLAVPLAWPLAAWSPRVPEGDRAARASLPGRTLRSAREKGIVFPGSVL